MTHKSQGYTVGGTSTTAQILSGDSDPSVSGVVAEVGSVYHRDVGGLGTTGESWIKFGAGNGDWSRFAHENSICPVVADTRANITALRDNSELNPGCWYEITDNAEALGDNIALLAVKDNAFAYTASYLWSGGEPWVCFYDIDDGEIDYMWDNLGNEVKESSFVNNFPWGNANFTNIRIIDAFSFTYLPLGTGTVDGLVIIDDAAVDVSGNDGAINHVTVQNSTFVAQNNQGSIFYCNVLNNSVLTMNNYGAAVVATQITTNNGSEMTANNVTSGIEHVEVNNRSFLNMSNYSGVKPEHIYVNNQSILTVDNYTGSLTEISLENLATFDADTGACQIRRVSVQDGGDFNADNSAIGLIVLGLTILAGGVVNLNTAIDVNINNCVIESGGILEGTGANGNGTLNECKVSGSSTLDFGDAAFSGTVNNCDVSGNSLLDFTVNPHAGVTSNLHLRANATVRASKNVTFSALNGIHSGTHTFDYALGITEDGLFSGTEGGLDIDGLTVETASDNADKLAIYDNSASANRGITRANFFAGDSVLMHEASVVSQAAGTIPLTLELASGQTADSLSVINNGTRRVFALNQLGQIEFYDDNTTPVEFQVGSIEHLLIVDTAASEQGAIQFNVADFNTLRTAVEIRANGTEALIGFLGATPVARQAALTAQDAGVINSGDATTDGVIANNRTRIAELEAALQNFGQLN